ncbi:MAG: TIM barrel protein [Planctomycetota bacterium]|nr:TIM barrel protein [Planctomycetota bacterium]
MNPKLTRRGMMATSLAGTAAVATSGPVEASPAGRGRPFDAKDDPELDSYRVQKGQIRQSVMGWCFNPMPAVELGRHCKAIGLVAMEGIGSQHYPAIRKLGLEISLVGSHGFAKGPVNPEYHAECKKKIMTGIDLAVEVGSPSVITFTGMSEKNIDRDQLASNCVKLWKEVIGYAEKNRINLVLEHLNSRDDSHPMKGHPGYFGDDVDFCVELIKKVGSPNMKLLFDVYHVQIMNGDVIRRLRAYQEYIGHYHTAGNPGRCELDEHQEINYPAVMRAILETGYEGYVAQEFIPTWKNRIRALRHAAKVCDV